MPKQTKQSALSRRDFLKIGSASLIGAAFRFRTPTTLEFPQTNSLGRLVEPAVKIHARPNIESVIVGQLYEDQVVSILQEVIGINPYRINQRWVETPEGYIWSPLVQQVKNLENQPVSELPQTQLGPGMWVEVSIPYIDVVLANEKPIAPRIKYLIENNQLPRLYYSQIIWVDDLKVDEAGQTWYHLRELYGSYGDHFWGKAGAFRPITPEETTPITPEIENKRIEINIPRQTMVCLENEREVHFARISSGRLGQETPIGNNFNIFWKLISVHMSAGTTGAGYDLAGVGWTTFFATGGIAIHSTFWHNDFGVPTSAGCINALPADAKFISRWTSPILDYAPGVVDVGSQGIRTSVVKVLEV